MNDVPDMRRVLETVNRLEARTRQRMRVEAMPPMPVPCNVLPFVPRAAVAVKPMPTRTTKR